MSARPGALADSRRGSPDRAERTVALIGMRCAGKTSVGASLARLLGRPLVDLDEEVVGLAAARRSGVEASRASAGDVLRREGIPVFRHLEAEALRAALDARAPFVLATGGGVVEREENQELIAARTFTVWLNASLPVLEHRLRTDPTERPPLGPPDPERVLAARPDERAAGASDRGAAAAELAELLARRAPVYERLADLVLDADSASPDELAVEIVSALDTTAD